MVIITVIISAIKSLFGNITFVVVRFLFWLDKFMKEQAQKKTEEGRAKDQAEVDDKAAPIFEDAKKSEESIEDLIKKRLG